MLSQVHEDSGLYSLRELIDLGSAHVPEYNPTPPSGALDRPAAPRLRDADLQPTSQPAPTSGATLEERSALLAEIDRALATWSERRRWARRALQTLRIVRTTFYAALGGTALLGVADVQLPSRWVDPKTYLLIASIAAGFVLLGLHHDDRYRYADMYARRLKRTIHAYEDLRAQVETSAGSELGFLKRKAAITYAILLPRDEDW